MQVPRGRHELESRLRDRVAAVQDLFVEVEVGESRDVLLDAGVGRPEVQVGGGEGWVVGEVVVLVAVMMVVMMARVADGFVGDEGVDVRVD